MLTYMELIAWIGNLFLMSGQFLSGRKLKCAPILCNIGNICYLVYATEKHAWALLAVTAVAFLIMLRNAFLWRKTHDCFNSTPVS